MILAPILLSLSAGLPSTEVLEPTPASTEQPDSPIRGGHVALRKGRMTLITDAGVEPIFGELGDREMAHRGNLELGALSEAELRWSGKGSLRAYGPASIEWSGSPFVGAPLGLYEFRRVELEVRAGELGVRLPGGVLLVATRSALELTQRSSGVFGIHHLGGQTTQVIVPAVGAPDARTLDSGGWIWIDPEEYLRETRFVFPTKASEPGVEEGEQPSGAPEEELAAEPVDVSQAAEEGEQDQKPDEQGAVTPPETPAMASSSPPEPPAPTLAAEPAEVVTQPIEPATAQDGSGEEPAEILFVGPVSVPEFELPLEPESLEEPLEADDGATGGDPGLKPSPALLPPADVDPSSTEPLLEGRTPAPLGAPEQADLGALEQGSVPPLATPKPEPPVEVPPFELPEYDLFKEFWLKKPTSIEPLLKLPSGTSPAYTEEFKAGAAPRPDPVVVHGGRSLATLGQATWLQPVPMPELSRPVVIVSPRFPKTSPFAWMPGMQLAPLPNEEPASGPHRSKTRASSQGSAPTRVGLSELLNGLGAPLE